MRHPLQHVPERVRLPGFLALAATAGVVHRRMGRMSAQNKTPAAPRGMLSLLLGGDVRRDREILASWDHSARARATHNLRLDPLFSLCWTGATGIGCLWAAGPLRRVDRVPAGLGVWLAWGQSLAAVLSAGKDFVLLRQLHRPRQLWSPLGKAAGLLEIALKSAGVAYVGAGGVAWCIHGIRSVEDGWLGSSTPPTPRV